MANYVAPTHRVEEFTCAACGTFSQQVWSEGAWYQNRGTSHGDELPVSRCKCVSCKAVSLWHKEDKRQIHPKVSEGPMPHPDLPEACSKDYLEARNVFSDSPRAAAALLRLCVQRLMPELGQPGKNIDSDIAALVKNGLPQIVQEALDICRVIGNNAVHPGAMSLDDDPTTVAQLFDLLNFIVAQTLEREKAVKAMYGKLPEGAMAAIAARNSKAKAIGVAAPVPPAGP